MSPAPGPDARLRPPPKCNRCLLNRVAWTKPRVDFCYDCLPGGPFTPPPCERCGSPDYFSQGMCVRCHPGGPLHVGACRGCVAWGVYRQRSWLCWSCVWWRTHYPWGVCDFCHRESWIADQGSCRLCLEQARMLQEPGRALDLAGANKHGQQLFFANMQIQRHRTRRLAPEPRKPKHNWKTPGGWNRPGPAPTEFVLAEWVQPALIDVEPDPELVRQRSLIENSELTRYCAVIVGEHAEQFGWSKRQRNDVVRSLRLLQTLRDSPTAKIRASDVLQLPRYDGNIISTLDVLDAAGLLIEDRPRPIETYFATKTAALPERMRHELETWLTVMIDGATTAPRQRSRDPLTVKVHVRAIVHAVTAWAEAGHQSLAEITAAEVIEALPDSGNPRALMERGLRSLFKTLKARKLIFANPMRGMKGTRLNATVPMPLDTALIRQELNSPNPAVALAVALVAFHALTAKQVSHLLLTDIVDGRLSLDGRSIPLAEPVRERLTRWLDYRQAKWPNSQNPHLIVNQRSAPRLMAASRTYPWQQAGIRPQKLREDRILAEVHATGGDARRISDLFGLGIDSTNRYLDTLEHPDLAENKDVPQTSTTT